MTDPKDSLLAATLVGTAPIRRRPSSLTPGPTRPRSRCSLWWCPASSSAAMVSRMAAWQNCVFTTTPRFQRPQPPPAAPPTAHPRPRRSTAPRRQPGAAAGSSSPPAASSTARPRPARHDFSARPSGPRPACGRMAPASPSRAPPSRAPPQRRTSSRALAWGNGSGWTSPPRRGSPGTPSSRPRWSRRGPTPRARSRGSSPGQLTAEPPGR